MQVCVISVITSVILFALPLAGRCHTCDSGNTEHCVKSESCCSTIVCSTHATVTWGGSPAVHCNMQLYTAFKVYGGAVHERRHHIQWHILQS